ncbi:MAG: DEAD/DEAH box helicase family protein, partial [Erysipelothrix sp.]|nr:DEAD/DEAH box helicase family protein [Erysipelothrix sp.]
MYLDKQTEQTNTYFISNNKNTNTIVLKELQKQLLACSSFSLSVAFITLSGISMILQQLKELKEKDVKGRILTSTYQMFNHPDVYRRLLRFSNVEVRIYSQEVHHTKGYIFNKEDKSTVIVGSSNLTESALKVNREWNLKIENAETSEMTHLLLSEYEEMWDKAQILDEAWIDAYSLQYLESQVLRQSFKNPVLQEKHIVPNIMQETALRNLDKLRKDGENKALLISATGTGKTYLAAFDVKNAAPKRVLFVIHREQIARDAMQTFKKVLPHMSMGFLSGTKKDINADAVFTTIQSMSLDSNLHQFSKEHFDYIIYDEAHRTGASSYLKVMDYFKAKFTLGMSATPERTDDFNTFELFDYNIAYEIRLQGALEEEMLTPFHYFGISDVTIDNELIEDKSKISNLLSVHRVDRIVEAMDYYGHSGVRVKGLIFCSRTEEALALSEKLNEHGLRTIALTGSNSQDEREDAVRRLSKDDGDLDYILTVDIFNEGIDIPEVNQVVMLRPTESAIVFVQQLGRGLRKTKNKEFVIVIDFIGNYKNNFMIPIALSGDKSMSPNNLRKYIMSGNSFIPKASTIEFDAIAKERIYESIDKSSFTSFSYLKKAYFELKYKLGHIPKLTEFLEYGALDPQVIFSHARFSNYHKFLKVVDKSYSVELSEVEDQILSYISKEFSSGKRLIE